jgi:hypothetical protein
MVRQAHHERFLCFRISYKILLLILLIRPLSASVTSEIFKQAGSKTKKPEVWLNIYVHGICSLKPLSTIANFIRFLNDDIGDSIYLDTVNIMRADPFFFQAQAIQDRGLQPINLDDNNKGAAASAMANIFEMVQASSSNTFLSPVRLDRPSLRLEASAGELMSRPVRRSCQAKTEWRGLPGPISPFPFDSLCSLRTKGGAEFILSLSKDRNERAGIHPEPCRRIDPNGFRNTSNAIKNYYYTYGWSGLFSKKAQYNDARNFLFELEKEVARFKAQGIQPKIRLFGYSHGGTVVLKMGMVKQKENLELSFSIDEAFLLGTPIQYDTDHYINDSLFKKIYNIFSRSDRVQKLDFLTCTQSLPDQIFKNHGNFVLPKKLVQIEIRVMRKKGEATKPLSLLTNQPINSGKRNHRDFRNVSPGHIELWFFGWTPKNYRPTFPLYPLPIVAFMPFIIKSIEPYESDPNVPITITIDVHRNSMLVNNHIGDGQPQALPFIGISKFLELKDFALKFKPDSELFNQKIYDEHINQAYNQALAARKQQ